uniref:Uncharacterized protein TCIL3000_11_16540 n=1 Tax=Trypanosoma congolense (strain IL3000) TaxID=1068625 RepID=G0V3B9_TRYCI|nr:unnamed protein product [Trypanosoma congolense IL3000]
MLSKTSLGRRLNGSVSTQVIIIGKRMVPTGCESLVCLSNCKGGDRLRRRVVLRGVAPGDVVRVPARFFGMIVEERRLPRPSHCWLMRGRRAGGPLWVRPSASPCAHHMAYGECDRCPWMGLAAATALEEKADHLRRAMERFLPAKTTTAGTEDEFSGGVGEFDNLSRARQLVLRFLEPFAVPLKLHQMREVEFYFSQADSSNSTAEGEPGAASSGGKFRFMRNSSAVSGCLLCTLEQGRLLNLLNQWAERLSAHKQQCLCSAFVLQQLQEGSARSWECDLHVTLLLRREVSSSDEQSPLCGSPQAEETLSWEEQQLVDAVLSAAPLTKRIGVSTVCTDGSVSYLYPHTRRLNWSDYIQVTPLLSMPSAPVVTAANLAADACFTCSAFHGPTGRVVRASFPFMHSTLAFALGERDLSALSSSSCTSVWRHAVSLEAVGSVVLSLLPAHHINGVFDGGNVLLLGGGSRKDAAEHGGDSQLLVFGLEQWLRALLPGPVVRDVDNIRKDGEPPGLYIFVLHGEADVDLVKSTVANDGALESRTPLRLLLLQLTLSGEFTLLAGALRGVQQCLRQRSSLHVDAGVIDVDPWASSAVGYLVVEARNVVSS